VSPPPLSFSHRRSLSVAAKGTLNMICSVTYSWELHICIYFCPSNAISYQVMLKQPIRPLLVKRLMRFIINSYSVA
jgi:hypothetical protein